MSFSKFAFLSSLFIGWCFETAFSCTTGGVTVEFPSSTLTSVESCDDEYDDPNNMGFYLFSISSSGSSSVSTNFKLSEFACLDGDDKLRLSPQIVKFIPFPPYYTLLIYIVF